jgi:hypothetical protein
MEIASIRIRTINHADNNYFGYRARIKLWQESCVVTCGPWYIGRMLVACYRRQDVNCVEIYVSKED